MLSIGGKGAAAPSDANPNPNLNWSLVGLVVFLHTPVAFLHFSLHHTLHSWPTNLQVLFTFSAWNSRVAL